MVFVPLTYIWLAVFLLETRRSMHKFLTILFLFIIVACGRQQTQNPAEPTMALSAPTATGAASALSPTSAATNPPIATSETQATARPTVTAAPPATAPTAGELVVMAHDSFTLSKALIADFEKQHNLKVTVLPSGDAGSALNKAILSKDAPLADVFFGVDNTFLSRALEANIFEPYNSPALANISDTYKLDTSNRLIPIDFGFVTINYDKAYLQKHNLTAPTHLRDLTKSEWKSLLVVENPATSSPGLAFLLASIAEFGTEGDYTWLNFWQDLRANDVLVVDGWNDAYYTHFSASSGQGPRPLVVSYTSSPAAEVFYSAGKLNQPPTANLIVGSFLQVEFAGVLKGAKNPEAARQFIDFLLSWPVQEDIPLQMFVYPVKTDAELPEVFKKFAPVPEQYASLPPDEISKNREAWIEAWQKVVLR